MNIDNLSEILIMILSIISVVMGSSSVLISTWTHFHLKKTLAEREAEHKKLEDENRIIGSIDYSEKILSYLRALIGQVAILKFQDFKDSHHIDITTREHLKPLIRTTIDAVKSSINNSNIDFDRSILKSEFYDKYIVDTTIYTVKQLFEREVSEINK